MPEIASEFFGKIQLKPEIPSKFFGKNSLKDHFILKNN